MLRLRVEMMGSGVGVLGVGSGVGLGVAWLVLCGGVFGVVLECRGVGSRVALGGWVWKK